MGTIDTVFYLLKTQGKSQAELASYLGIGKNRITDWKSGRLSSYTKYLPQMAAFFGVTVDELLGNDIEKKEASPPSGDSSKARFLKAVESLSADELKELENYLDYILSKRKK